MKSDQSHRLWEEANRVLVGGVNSPVRAFNGVGGEPFFAASGRGARVVDVDGNEFIDYVLSWGPLVLGHAHPVVVEALTKALERGTSFGIPTEAEIRLADRLIAHVPSIEKVRMVNSGTEATMSAIRLARGCTGRDLIVKVEGCYHGHADSLLVRAGSGLATLGIPSTPGVPSTHAHSTLTVPFNDLKAARALFEARGAEVACLILEPVPGNMGVILPQPGYLEGLRALTREHGTLLIFDEVMSGFRVAMGGAQARFGITPDLTTLGKVIGGGLPVGAYGGPAAIMDALAPKGPVYQAGTLSGNPLAMAAGLATIEELEKGDTFSFIEAGLTQLIEGLGGAARAAGIPVCLSQAGSMGGLFFHEGPVFHYGHAKQSDTKRYARFFWGMLERGTYFAPSQFEACFMSSAHRAEDIQCTIDAAQETFAGLE